MEEKSFRTYRRRDVTRRSGNKASGVTTGGECIIQNSDNFVMTSPSCEFVFETTNISLENLFELDMGIIAFGGYIKPSNVISIELEMFYESNSEDLLISGSRQFSSEIMPDTWNGIGMHTTQKLEPHIDTVIEKVTVIMRINGVTGTNLNFAAFDLNAINYQDYLSNDFYEPFKQKTNMHIPHIYYLSTDYEIEQYLVSSQGVEEDIYIGEPIVLKGCNRCTRYLPINIFSEEDTLAFSLHCKKKAPCKHNLFSSYKINNYDSLDEIEELDLITDYISEGRVHSHYGHQLECRACKKYYVNFALNPLRNAQQFKEDGLRRRALEVLVNTLLDQDLIHHEYENRTKKQFTEHIWKKFDKRCFKCAKKLKINEMHLDHTMPLAYLYRLDETATCLCAEHNSKKRDSFPADFYSNEERIILSQITGLDYAVLSSRTPNMKVVELLIENIEWFFDTFLMHPDYQKVRDGRLTADKIYASLVRILKGTDVDLLRQYQLVTGRNPISINL